MARDIPMVWIEKLFARMSATFGYHFTSMWKGVDIAEVKQTWRLGLADITDEGWQRGVAKLADCPRPPSLPEFRKLCQSEPAMYRPNLPALEATTTPTNEAREQAKKLRALVGSVSNPVGGIAWAHKILARADNGEKVSPAAIEAARQGIENYRRDHGTEA